MHKTTHLFCPEWCSSTLHDAKKFYSSLLITNKERRKVYRCHSGKNKCVIYLRIGCRPYLWKWVYNQYKRSKYTIQRYSENWNILVMKHSNILTETFWVIFHRFSDGWNRINFMYIICIGTVIPKMVFQTLYVLTYQTSTMSGAIRTDSSLITVMVHVVHVVVM